MYFLTKKFILHRAAEQGAGLWWRLERGHCATFPTHAGQLWLFWSPALPMPILWGAGTCSHSLVRCQSAAASRFVPQQQLLSQVGMGLFPALSVSLPQLAPRGSACSGSAELQELCGGERELEVSAVLSSQCLSSTQH